MNCNSSSSTSPLFKTSLVATMTADKMMLCVTIIASPIVNVLGNFIKDILNSWLYENTAAIERETENIKPGK